MNSLVLVELADNSWLRSVSLLLLVTIEMWSPKLKLLALTMTNLPTYAPSNPNFPFFMSQFGLELDVILTKSNGDYKIVPLKELLPYTFTASSLTA